MNTESLWGNGLATTHFLVELLLPKRTVGRTQTEKQPSTYQKYICLQNFLDIDKFSLSYT